MNTWRKFPDGSWGIQSDRELSPGEVVVVTNRSGATKSVTVGGRVGNGTSYGFAYTLARAPQAEVAVGNLDGVLQLFAKAKQRLRYPAIVLSVPDANLSVRLSVAGPAAKVPGSINVLSVDKGYDGRDWFGRILVDGTFKPAQSLNGRADAVAKRLREFACDPARVAAEHGKLTGQCCFCNRALTDERSTEVGYGATCATHYGLPWGSKAEVA
jgi:hypothetical protein